MRAVSAGAVPETPAPDVFKYSDRQRKQDAFFAGFIAGVLSIVGTYWLDVKKVQRQMQAQRFRPYKGVGPAMGSQAFRTGVTYCGFDSLGAQFRSWGLTGWHWQFVAAASGAVVGELVAVPFEVWKNTSIKNQGIPTHCIPRWILDHNGPQGFFKGVLPAVLRKSISNGGMLSSSPHTILFVHRGLCWVCPEQRNSTSQAVASKLIGGGVTGGCMEVLTLPIDKCRLYTQVLIHPDTGRTYTILQAGQAMWAQGVISWYAGAVSAFTRKGLIKAVQYFVLLELVALFKGRRQSKWQAERAAEKEMLYQASLAAAAEAAEAKARFEAQMDAKRRRHWRIWPMNRFRRTEPNP
uniref:Mitochondrial carrier protein n=1 Tax=Eutreptiella gymnastica TaxID=73025 RepID=A0A7S1I4M4_9EUGL|mmetsp:Transcript_130058/g.224816  ORF Transcript_130058/g.224816 Transcript_130058/m.224816 type:complete len:351 (+) Transcript_130058:95-1147(+)